MLRVLKAVRHRGGRTLFWVIRLDPSILVAKDKAHVLGQDVV
jgi:hypothetical protein